MTEFRYRKTTQQQTESINLFREGMIYRFLKTGRFRRILFLVDRTALGEQASDVFREAKLEDLMTLNEIYSIK